MSQKTIRAQLVTTDQSRRAIWELMAERNTPLINTLLDRIATSSSFEEQCCRGSVPQSTVKEFCQTLREDSQFAGQPGRFYTSAITIVTRTFKSWLRLRSRLVYRLEGKIHWLQILQSDEDLAKAGACDLEALRVEASRILLQISPKSDRVMPEETGKVTSDHRSKKRRKSSGDLVPQQKHQKQKSAEKEQSQISLLFDLHRDTEDQLLKASVAYLLKYGGKLPSEPEDPKKFAKRRRKAEIAAERLTKTLARMRSPKGRDLTGQKWLETLEVAASKAPADEDEASLWQAILLSEASKLPFPVTYETNEDLSWFLNEKGRLCVSFNGLGEHTFEIYCDERQLHWFKRFLQDQEVKKASRNQHSAALFTLRSARLAWEEDQSEGEPWTANRLVLFCTIETDCWTAAGTEKVSQEKATECAKVLAATKVKNDLTANQEAFVRRREKTLAMLSNPFPRPNRPLYKGNPSMLAGVSYGLDRPATLAIVDVTRGTAVTYRSIRQLLGDNYKLLNRYRLRQQRNAHQRHNTQRRGAPNQVQESNLGEQIDRLIAKAIVMIAQEYQVSSIVLPQTTNIREVIQAEIQTRAEQRIPGYLEGQRRYAKEYRTAIHRWSYSRLTANIQNQAAQAGIAIEIAQQSLQGTPQEKARSLVIAAYFARQ